MTDVQPLAPARQQGLAVAVLLTLSGGFLDAFTFIGHGGVFANAMTGNVVLLGAFAALGDWPKALRHIPPILAFLAGVYVAHALRLPRFRARLGDAGRASLVVEILFLAAASFTPRGVPDAWLVMGISFVAAIQSSSFPRLERWAYNSVMTTGNLRRFAESLYAGLSGQGSAFTQARLFGTICCAFLVGAAAGGFATMRLLNLALWVPVALLAAALALCLRPPSAEVSPASPG